MVLCSSMKNLMINKNILKENLQAPKQYISNDNGKNINFETFLRNEYKIEAAKYPFLSKTQIKQRVINMWKKQHASRPKLNGRKFRDKSDKRSQQKSAEKGNYRSKNDIEHTPPRHRSKRDLVPLKVNFIPTKDDGILKRNSNSNGEKRRVSFNKKLYIRYRTTSEESSSSTLKDKQNIKQKRKPLKILSNNQPETYKSYGFNTSTLKQKKSTLDQKFDELLNENCSWSYKPHKETLNKNMDTQAENLQPLQTTLEVQITEDKCEKALNDMSSRIYMLKCSNDLPAKENINELADSTVQERNNHQMKTRSSMNRIMKKKFKNINVKLSTSESDKTKTTRISMNEIIESSSSSDEILQTKYSVNNNTIFPIDEYHSNDCSPIFMGRTSDKESISENTLNTKTSPIIIQARAYNENKDFNGSNSDQIMSDVKQKEEIAMNSPNVGIKNRYSLGITTNYSDDTESNSIPIANRDEQFDKEISDDIVKDFINGSFDITKYQLKKPSVAGQSEKQYMAIMQEIINTQNIQGRNSNNKSGIKKAKTAPKVPRTVKKSTEFVHKKLDNNEVNSKVYSKGKRKRIMQGNKTKDIFDNKEQDLTLKRKNYSPNKTPPNTRKISQKKCKDDNIIIESPYRSSTPARYPKRKLRNSSLVASKKIREIEQLENMSDSCEEIIYSNDEINYTYKPCKYSNSNNILTGKVNELKKKQDMLNIVKNKKQSETASEENEEANDASNYFRLDEMKNITPTTYKKTLFQNPLKAFDQSESLSRKDKVKRNYFPDLNSFQKDFTSGTNNDLNEDLKNGFEDKTTNYNLKDISYGKNETEPTNSKNINSFDETKKESKQKTWESLERDLLKELDDMPYVDNICKTVILQEEEVIRKKEVANDTNLFTVSNTSMLQTIQKCIRSNKYNMHYEIKNTESKIYESKAEKNPYQFQNRVSAPYSNETGPICKSISILNKTIAAMEECTKNLILPQVNIFDYEQKETNFQFEDATDNSDTNHETQFHTSVTFMAKNNKQYYSNEIIGYMKKSKRNSEKINLKKSNVTTLVKNLRDEPNKHEASDYGESNHAEQLGQSISVSKNYLLENHPKKSLYEIKSQALVPNSDGKCNPWSILMDKLDVSDNYEEDNNKHMIPDSGHTCQTDKKVKKKIFEPFIAESYMKESLKDTYHTDKIVISVDNNETMKIQEQTLKKQGEIKEIGHNTAEQLVSEVYGYKIIDFEERSSLCETEISNNVAQEKNNKNDNKNEKNQEMKPLKEREIFEKPVPKQCEEKILKRSPKYKLRIDRDGSLKIKHSNESSSVSNSSQDFKESRKTSTSDLKSHKRSHITNNTREKYTRYLKRKLDKQALLLTEEKTDRTKSEDEQPKNVSKVSENVSKENENVTEENPNQDRNNQQLTRVKLIAENDDDIFSLSSSDSETSSKKNPGSGLLCNLFDE